MRVQFSKLNSSQMQEVLEYFGKPTGKNLAERKEIFSKIVLDKNLGYDKISSVINKIKEK